MKFSLKPGTEIETLTPDEAAKLLASIHERDRPRRVRATSIVTLDANGNGQDEIYTVPAGFEFEARRTFLDLDTANDPATGNVVLDQSTGAVQEIVVANPAAGAEWASVVPAGVQWQLLGIYAELSTSAAVANRVARFGVLDASGNTIFRVGSSSAEAASLVWSYNVIPGGNLVSSTPLTIVLPLPQAEWLPAGAQVVSSTLNKDVADQWQNIRLLVAVRNAGARAVEYLRSGQRIEYAIPQSPNGGDPQVPGVQTWGAEQGPYLRNGETFEVKARGLTANAHLSATVEGILTRPPQIKK